MSDEECVRAPRRGKRPALHLESSSDSESDCAVEVVNKKKKTNIIESESSSESCASSEDDTRTARPTKQRPRVSSDNDSSSEASSNESSEESDESSCEDSDDNVAPHIRGRNGRVTRSRRVQSEEESSSESESEETSSESGHSSVGSYESYDNTEEEAMIQAAIQESLASAPAKPSEADKSEPSEKTTAKKETVETEAGGFASDTSDGQSEKCPICLLSFTDQEIGSPETCDHTFCSVCIQEWAKNVNTCPVDRQVFSLILVRKQLNGKVIKKIPIANREARDPHESDSDPTFCEVCGRSDREDRLLLCDGCDLGYHLECLNPPMENVPIEEWFCPECATDQTSPLAEEIDVQDGELFDLLDDMVQIRPRTSRLLPRTRQSERVRATLRSLHQEFLHRTHEPALQQPSTSGIESVGADSSSVASGARVTSAASASTVRRRKVVRRKTVKKRRKRRTTKRTTKRKPVRRKKKVTKKIAPKGSGDESEEIEEYVTKTKRRKRRRRKMRRRKKVSRRKTARTAVPRSVKGRLAEQLGLCASTRPGMSLPVIRSRVTTSDIDLQRSRAGIPTLHIYGPQNELDYFSSDNEDVMESGGLAVAARPRNAHVGTARLMARKKLSAAALQSHTAVVSPKPARNRVNVGGNAVASSPPVDLIGSILDSQAIWHSKKSSVTIKPDGSLEVNKDLGGTAVANTQGTVECDSVSNKNKSNDSLIRSDDRLSEVNGSSTSPIDLGNASARTTQAPMYPGRGDNHNRPPPSSGFHQFGGSRYSAPSYSNYQSGRDFSNFSSSAPNFDASSTRAGYSNYLNSGLPPAPLRNTPVRFRVTPRYPIRRPQGPQRPQDSLKHDDKRSEDDGEGCQKTLEEEEDDEIDIYSDIEAGGGGSGGPSGGGSELDEAERSMETSYEALPPPPEPSALLMGFGEQALSEEEPTSDSELVIDDNVGPPSPHDQNETCPQIPESEKYDPAEPLADSDEDNDVDDDDAAAATAAAAADDADADDDDGHDEPEITVPVRNEVPDQDIPLPPAPPSVPFQSSTNISQHIINSSSNSNASYLHSPTYGETSFETEKMSAVTDEGVVNKVVKEVISERLKSASGIIGVGVVHGSPTHPNVGREDEEDECPNFSIYSATSMDIARRTGEETIDVDSKVEDEKMCESSENETKEEREIEGIENDSKPDKIENESEGKAKSLPDDNSPSASPDVKQMLQVPDREDGSEETEDEDAKKEFIEEEETKKDNSKEEAEDDDDDDDDHDDHKDDLKDDQKDDLKDDEFVKADQIGKDDQSIQELKGVGSDSSIEDLSPEKVVSDAEDKDEHDATNAEISKEERESMDEDEKGKSLTSSKEFDEPSEEIPHNHKPLANDPFDSDNDSVIGNMPSAVSVVVRSIDPLSMSAPSGLEGLDTETISETEEAINFDDISQDGNDLPSAEEDGEISSAKKRKKKKNRRTLDVDGKILSDLSGELPTDRERTPPEEGEIIDDRPKLHDTGKRDKVSVEKKDVSHEVETAKISDENFDISKSKDDDKKKKKKDKRKSSEKAEDRPVLGSSENRRKSKEKSRRSEEPNISWKKPSKSTKERNYRDTKTSKPDDVAKEKDKDDSKDSNKKKKKEKRKDMERYDVRKIVSDKRRRRKDEFGRDLSRDRTCSRSRSRSHRRSRSLSKNRRHRSPVRVRRSRSRSRYRSRSRSYRRSRSKSKNRSRRKSKDKGRRSRSKERTRVRLSRSRSRGRRSRSRSGSHNRSKNKARLRTRSRSPVKQRKERADRSHVIREVQRFHTRRSWSRTWTPSWSRSRSRSLSCSSFTQSRSPSVRHFNRSFSHSFSRSWSRERYERIPLEKTGTLSGKPTKKLTVIVSNTKENSDRQKKDKKKKKDKKNKEILGAMEKRKKRKEKSPAPSKEVFTSGDNILVSVNFNKSSKTGTSKDISTSLPVLSKEATKRKREETFEAEREIGKKIRKEKNKEKNKGISNEKNSVGLQAEKKGKKQGARGNKSARMAALLKQKPVAIIDLDQSPFREQTPSPRDLIVLSDSDDDERNKGVEHEEIGEALSVCRNLRPDISSPQSPAKGVHSVPANISVVRSPESELKLMSAVSNYLTTSTGPKTPPEPQIKFSIATKQPQLRVINNPLQEDDDILPEDGGLDDSDQRIEEELDRSLGEIVYKGPNTPPEPRGPTTPCSPPTSPDAYDPFDPTKSGTPSPAGPEASMDGPPSPPRTPADMQMGNVEGLTGRDSPLQSDLEDMVNKNAEARNKSPPMQPAEETAEEARSSPKVVTRDTKSPVGLSETIVLTPQLQNEELPVAEITDVSKVSHGLPSNITSVSISENNTKSPERKIGVVMTTPQSKLQSTPIKPPVFPVPSLKQAPTSQQTMTSTPSHAAPPPIFPSLTPVNIASMLCTPTANLALSRSNLFTPQTPMSVPSLLQHVSNSATPVQTRLSTDKSVVPAVPIRSLVQNGEQLPKPQDTTTEVVDMDLDSPYSPGSSEGDDLFDPPADTPTRTCQPAHSTDRPKAGQSAAKNANKLAVPASNLPSHKSPSKNQDKFDSLFTAGAPPKAPGSAPAKGRTKSHKGTKAKTKHVKGGKKEIAIKMDEDQLQILDELPSSAVELQVKDKFLKKLNRQERVVEEVKLSLKPHYNRKHISKEEYKDILRKSVPKICHNKSGEINPVKIATLVEAYVKKVRYEKKKSANSGSGTNSTPAKAKAAKTTKWS